MNPRVITLQADTDPSVLRAHAGAVRSHLARLHGVSTEDLLALCQSFSEGLAASSVVNDVEGAAFLVYWLKRSNLEKVLEQGLHGGRRSLDGFVERGRGEYLRAQAAGVTSHWVAGNVPTLGIFSWLLSLLTKNAALVRLGQDIVGTTSALLEVLAQCRGGPLEGEAVLEAARFISFPSHAQQLNQEMSLAADTRVVWGGEAAVRAIVALERSTTCNDVVFGPKYSIGVIARSALSSAEGARQIARGFVRDVIAFDQAACSSPQTVFFERPGPEAAVPENELLGIFADELRQAAKRSRKAGMDAYTATQIFAARARWGLAADREFLSSVDADWTVCLDRELSLKDAIQSRTLFLTAVDSIMDVVPLLSSKIQTIGIACQSLDALLRFADAATLRGVSRCLKPGTMNVYDLPWDGRMALAEMVRWVSVKT